MIAPKALIGACFGQKSLFLLRVGIITLVKRINFLSPLEDVKDI